MRFLRNFFIFLIVVSATLLTLFGTLLNWPDRFPGKSLAIDLVRQIQSLYTANVPRLKLPFDATFSLWAIGFILCLLVIFITFAIRPRKLQIERRVEGGGRVVMSEAATKQYLHTALGEFGDLVCKRISLHPGPRRSVVARVVADLHTQQNVPDLEKRLIQRVHSSLTHDLGIDRVSRVDVQIHKFGLRVKRAARAAQPEVIVGSSTGKETTAERVDLQAAEQSIRDEQLLDSARNNEIDSAEFESNDANSPNYRPTSPSPGWPSINDRGNMVLAETPEGKDAPPEKL